MSTGEAEKESGAVEKVGALFLLEFDAAPAAMGVKDSNRCQD